MNYHGRSAFPRKPGSEPGLTKREFVAAMLLQGMFSGPTGEHQLYMGQQESLDKMDRQTEKAVRWADALLAKLDGKKK